MPALTSLTRCLPALLLIVAATCAQGADVFKWRDAEGKLQYGDKPPPGVKAEKVTATVTTVPAAKNIAMPRATVTEEQPASAAPASSGDPVKIDGATRQKLLEACEAAGGNDCNNVVNEALNAAVKMEADKTRQ